MTRPKRGPIYDMLPNAGQMQALKMLLYGLNSILFKWLMLGPGTNNASLMVNASQMHGNTGRMGKHVEVVDL
jgi:hypothetical protein